MPELPEVQTTVNGLQSKVLHRTFIDVWSDWPKMVKRPKIFGDFKKRLCGKKIVRVWRRAKNVIFELSGGHSLLVHMKMTGHLLYGAWSAKRGAWESKQEGPLRDRVNGFLHIIFTLDNSQMIALSDMRKFAKVELWETGDLLNSKAFLGWGPEPLEKSFTFAKFKEQLKDKRGRVKQVIMRPEVIAGVGNIYASEALWWAKIHPAKDTNQLSEKELRALYVAIKKVLVKGITLGGESFADYRNVDGERGHFDGERKAYKRERKPCKRCKTLIQRIMFGGRSAFFCPKCQRLK